MKLPLKIKPRKWILKAWAKFTLKLPLKICLNNLLQNNRIKAPLLFAKRSSFPPSNVPTIGSSWELGKPSEESFSTVYFCFWTGTSYFTYIRFTKLSSYSKLQLQFFRDLKNPKNPTFFYACQSLSHFIHTDSKYICCLKYDLMQATCWRLLISKPKIKSGYSVSTKCKLHSLQR